MPYGFRSEAPASVMYSSVVARDSIHLAFLIASLNDVDILSCNLENAFLNAPCCKKNWFEGGLECGEDKGKVLIVIHALYGLKSMGASWRSALADVLSSLGYELMKADLVIWIHKAVCDDGFESYEMLFVNILSLSHWMKEAIEEITKFYKVMDGSIKEPNIYLGANISKIQMPDGREVWSSSTRNYVKSMIDVVE